MTNFWAQKSSDNTG